MASPESRLLLTCEHGGNRVPVELRPLFAGRERVLHSHRGWDPGALPIARALARSLGAPLIATTTSRLVVDANRSPHNPRVFSTWSRTLSADRRAQLLVRYHAPHWMRVREALARAPGPIVHVGVHSFTPRLGRSRRRFAVGLLYDPQRPLERGLAIAWQAALQTKLGTVSEDRGIRRNAPYRGTADGLTTALRREHDPDRYLGLELELNQSAIATPAQRRTLVPRLSESLLAALDSLGWLADQAPTRQTM